MKIVALSDTHGEHEQVWVPEGDIVIHAGDATNQGDVAELQMFTEWFARLPHRYKIFVAGNHDWAFERDRDHAELLMKTGEIVYLFDAGVHIEGLHIFGSPWVPTFCNWAFNVPRDELAEKREVIPQGVDILVTHGPPFGYGDDTVRAGHQGDETLLDVIDRVRPRLHCFGDIHEGYGAYERGGTMLLNCSAMNYDYEIANPPHVVNMEARD